MKRNITGKLLEWKSSNKRKPLLLIGARQVGKTYSLKEFGKNYYEKMVYINFERQQEYKQIFSKDRNPKRIISEIELMQGEKIDIANTLIVLDEIQECAEAITTMKYFYEEYPEYHIACAGSLLGVMLMREKFSFPVGKVDRLTMYPLSFDEFLTGTNNQLLLDAIINSYNINQSLSEPIHEKALDLYKRYVCVGGYPEVVASYIENNQDLMSYDSDIKKRIIEGYIADMSKYSTSTETMKITSIYKSLPKQLARENTKFKYSEVKKGGRAKDYLNSIDWLLESNVNLCCYAVDNTEHPLESYKDETSFKLYMNDIGLLMTHVNIPYKVVMFNEDNIFKGSLTENYVATALNANQIPLYYYKKNTLEIDFISRIDDDIIPIEVKASDNTRSKSLNKYIEKYNPPYSIRVSTKNFGITQNIKSVPLYAVFMIGSKIYKERKMKGYKKMIKNNIFNTLKSEINNETKNITNNNELTYFEKKNKTITNNIDTSDLNDSPCVYIFYTHNEFDLEKFKENKIDFNDVKYGSKTNPNLDDTKSNNDNQYCFYLGKSYICKTRINQHIENNSGSTYSLRLNDTNRENMLKHLKLNIFILKEEYIEYAKIILPLIEEKLHDECKPLVGTSRT